MRSTTLFDLTCLLRGRNRLLCMFDLGYNDSRYNDNLFVAILSHGIDYFVKKITITSVYRVSLRFQGNFDSFVRKS